MDEEAQIDEAITELLKAAQTKFRYEHARLIGTAAYYAAKAHKGQERKSGGPYVLHPIRVAKKLVELDDERIDVTTICAALLHDALEDTKLTTAQIDEQFGRDVTSLVQSLTKKKNADKPKQEEDQEYFEQLRRNTKQNPRIGLIKILDVLDNAQTIYVHPKKRQEQRLSNIKEFYIPLAEQIEQPSLAKKLQAILDNPPTKD